MGDEEVIEQHDPSKYEFINKAKESGVQEGLMSENGEYLYTKPLKFEGDYATVYQTNTQIYKTANMVDGMASALALLSGVKLGSNFYALAFATGSFSIMSTGLWSLILTFQIGFLRAGYLHTVFLIENVKLHKDMDKIKVKTLY